MRKMPHKEDTIQWSYKELNEAEKLTKAIEHKAVKDTKHLLYAHTKHQYLELLILGLHNISETSVNIILL